MHDDDLKNDARWRDSLSPDEYRICRQKGTEPAFSGAFWDHKGKGTYTCKCCGKELFASAAKYDSGSGWPSFYQPIEAADVAEQRDATLLMERTEILCAHCDNHLGHVFPDGPAPTGLRYCVNSASLNFRAEDT